MFVSPHSPVPCENFVPRCKENGGNTAFFDHAGFRGPVEAAVSAALLMPATTAELLQRDGLLFFAEFLESWIATQWIPDGIEPKKSRCYGGYAAVNQATIGCL